jgi:(E)-4-hydroxy-3-methylbut-2-enyl-diphosphate synthase
VRVAVDSVKDVQGLAAIRRQTRANLNLVVDLQENYRLAASVAPHVDKVRYNPGHLWHHEKTKPCSRPRSSIWVPTAAPGPTPWPRTASAS